MSVSIYEVAKRAGVSISTVSRVMNGKGGVKEAKEKAVLEAIEYFQYEPNQLARGLVRKKSDLAGVYIPAAGQGAGSVFESLYTLECLRGVDEVLAGSGYGTVLLHELSGQTSGGSFVYERYVKQNVVDALLFPYLPPDSALLDSLRRLIDTGYPVGYIGKRFYHEGVNVYAEYDLYTRQMYELLIQKGHRKIVSIVTAGEERRLRPLASELMAGGFGVEICFVIYEEPIRLQMEAVRAYIERSCRNDCTVVTFYRMEIGAMISGICADLGINCPEDISLLGVEHRKGEGQNLVPPIDAFYVPAYEMGKALAGLVVDRIDGKESLEETRILSTRYIKRCSVKEIHS